MPTLEEMASKGEQKLRNKAGSMATSWNAAKSRMASNYSAAGFGPTRNSNYQSGISNATYRTPDPTKWRTNWLAKMRE